MLSVGRFSVFSTWTWLSLFVSGMRCPVLASAQFV
jgi:hypothetical protein